MGRSLKWALIRSSEGSWSASFLPKAAAMVSLVKSSAVGPKPPVVMMVSARALAMSSTAWSRWGLSPHTVWKYTLIPSSASPWAIMGASVFTVSPSSSSVPTDMISHFMDKSPLFCIGRQRACPPGWHRMVSTPATACSTSAATSSLASSSSTLSSLGFVWGCRGVNTVQQSS